MIRHLRHNEIDRQKWDRVVAQWSGQPYALSWWLDTVSPGWEGLVNGDYEAVMPLPLKRRFGLTYLVQPRFCQQLGVFGCEDTAEFLKRVPYLSYDINLNYRNTFNRKSFRWHTNYIINNVSGFDSNTKRNIRKADRMLEYRETTAHDFMDLWKNENRRFGEVYAHLLGNLLTECLKREMAMLVGAFSEGKMVSAIFTVLTSDRIILLAPVSDDEGKKLSAMFGIVSHIINNNQDKVIDCEGSMLPGVARFYRGLGGVEQNYRRIWRLSWRSKK